MGNYQYALVGSNGLAVFVCPAGAPCAYIVQKFFLSDDTTLVLNNQERNADGLYRRLR